MMQDRYDLQFIIKKDKRLHSFCRLAFFGPPPHVRMQCPWQNSFIIYRNEVLPGSFTLHAGPTIYRLCDLVNFTSSIGHKELC